MKRKLTSVYSLPSLRNRIPPGFHNNLVKPLLIHRNCEITNVCFFLVKIADTFLTQQ